MHLHMHTCECAHEIVEYSPSLHHSPFLDFSFLESTISRTNQVHVAVLLYVDDKGLDIVLNPDCPNPEPRTAPGTSRSSTWCTARTKNPTPSSALCLTRASRHQPQPYTIHHTPINTYDTTLVFSNTAMPDAHAGSSRGMQRHDA